MTALQKLLLKKSEARERLLVLGGRDSLTEEQETEMDSLATDLAGLERRERALRLGGADDPPEDPPPDKVTDPPPENREAMDAEERERLELRGKSTVAAFVLAAMKGRRVDGAEAEYAAAHGIHNGDIPLDIFEGETRQAKEAEEDRAVTASPADVGVNMAPIQPAVFAPSIAGRMGIDMPNVASGTFAQSRISTPLTAGPVEKGVAAAATAALFTTGSTTPHRISARLEFLAEDVAAAGVSNFEAALRENLSMALSAELDDAMINGDPATDANSITGLLKQLGDAGAQGAELTFANGVAAVAALVDGLWAMNVGQVRQIVGVDTYRKAAALLGNAGGADMTLADYLNERSGGFVTNSRMPAKAAAGAADKNQAGIAFRSGRSGLRTAVCPHWGRLSIQDIYTGAAKAETAVTFHVLLGDVLVVQPGAYAITAYQVDG